MLLKLSEEKFKIPLSLKCGELFPVFDTIRHLFLELRIQVSSFCTRPIFILKFDTLWKLCLKGDFLEEIF